MVGSMRWLPKPVLGDEEEVVANTQLGKGLKVGHEFVAILETEHERQVEIVGSSGILIQGIGMAVIFFADGGAGVVPKETDFGKGLEFAHSHVKPKTKTSSGTEAGRSSLADLAAIQNLEITVGLQVDIVVELSHGKCPIEENGSFKLLCFGGNTCAQQGYANA